MTHVAINEIKGATVVTLDDTLDIRIESYVNELGQKGYRFIALDNHCIAGVSMETTEDSELFEG